MACNKGLNTAQLNSSWSLVVWDCSDWPKNLLHKLNEGSFSYRNEDPALFCFTSWIPLGCFTVSTNSLPAPQEGGFVVRDHFPSLQQPPRRIRCQILQEPVGSENPWCWGWECLMINLSIHEPQKRRGGWFTKRNNEKKCISYIKYIMNNIDIYIYTWMLFVLWDHMFEETSMKVPKDGSIPGKIHRIFEAMFPFLEAAYPWPQQLEFNHSLSSAIWEAHGCP